MSKYVSWTNRNSSGLDEVIILCLDDVSMIKKYINGGATTIDFYFRGNDICHRYVFNDNTGAKEIMNQILVTFGMKALEQEVEA